MNENSMSVRDAGKLIASSGLTGDVIKADQADITQRRGRQREEADADAPKRRTREEDTREAPKKKAPPIEEADDDASEIEDEADDDGEADDTASNREGEDDGEGEADDDVDGEEGEADDDGEEADDKAKSLDAEYTVKVNGKEFTVTAKELVAGYQRGKDYQQKTQALAGKNRDLTAKHTEVAQGYVRKLQQANMVLAGVRQLLIGDIDSNVMRELRAKDPTQWMVVREEMNDRIRHVDTVLHSLHQEHERHANELTAQQKANVALTAGQERELILQHIPDWDAQGSKRLAAYLDKSGFRADEYSNVIDNRMLVIADKARRWDEYQAQRNQQPTRKVKTAPKITKPNGTRVTSGAQPAQQRRTEFVRAKDRARKTGDMRDAGNAINLLLSGRRK